MGLGSSKISEDLALGYVDVNTEKQNEIELEKSMALVEYFKLYGFTSKPVKQPQPSNKQIQELVFEEFGSLRSINGCNRGLSLISQNLAYLMNTTKLMLCCNELLEIPPEIGYMKNLVLLSLSNNKLVTLPDEIGHLAKLNELTICNNQLAHIPSSIGFLSELTMLHLSGNQLQSLPNELGMLKKLQELDVSKNPLEMIPEELSRLSSLKVIESTDCPFLPSAPLVGSSKIISLKELAFRVLVRNRMVIEDQLNPSLRVYFHSAHSCSYCGGPYFDQYESRVRMVFRNDKIIPFEARLCVAHWNTDNERIVMLFRPLPDTALTVKLKEPSTVQFPFRSRSSSVSTPERGLQKSPSLPQLPPSPQLRKKDSFLRRLSTMNLKKSQSLSEM